MLAQYLPDFPEAYDLKVCQVRIIRAAAAMLQYNHHEYIGGEASLAVGWRVPFVRKGWSRGAHFYERKGPYISHNC